MELLKGLSLDKWYKVLIAPGLIISVAAIAAKYPAAIFIGLGLASFGVGELVNHPLRTALVPATFDFPAGIVEITTRLPSIGGLIGDAVGVLLIGLGLWKLALL